MEINSPIEAIIAIETDNRNFSIYDIHTASSLVNFHGQENYRSNCLSVINNQHFITVNDNIVQIWSIFNRRCQDQKLFLPNKPSCLIVSPCANYLIAGINEAVYIWQIQSGYLLCHLKSHYQDVSAIQMNQGGTILVTAANDGVLMVWSFADLLGRTNNLSAIIQTKSREDSYSRSNHYLHSWQNHSGPITDVEITSSGLCMSVSSDMTLNIYDYVKGKRLANLTLPTQLHSIEINRNETTIYLGGRDGKIYEVAISSLSVSNIYGESSEKDERTMTGHSGKVTHLVMSTDGSKLISGSEDGACKVWDIYTRKVLRQISLKSPLTNVSHVLVPKGLALTTMTGNTCQKFQIKALSRNVFSLPSESTVALSCINDVSGTTIVYCRNTRNVREPTEAPLISTAPSKTKRMKKDKGQDESIQEERVEKLKQRIDELYNLKVEEIFKSAVT